MPAFSVIVPAYKAARWLPEALTSVKCQRLRDWELIVTEDGSDDETRQIVGNFAASVGQRVTYLRHDVNQGLSATRNTGLNSAVGTYAALLDADDLWTPDHLANAAAIFGEQNPDVIYAASDVFDNGTGETLEIRKPSESDLTNLPLAIFQKSFIQPSAAIVQRLKLLSLGGFDEEFRFCEDVECWLRLLRSGATFRFTGQATCRYRRHAMTLTRKSADMAFYRGCALERFADWDQIPKNVRRQKTLNAFMSAGRITFRSDPARAAQHFRRAWRFDRRNVAAWLFWLAAIIRNCCFTRKTAEVS